MPKVKGIDIFVEVNTGTEAVPVWTKVGGQRGASMSQGLGKIDVTDKDSAGWEEDLEGNRTFEIEFDSFLIEDDAGFLEVKKGYWERKLLHLRLKTVAKTYTGKFRLGETGIEGPHDDAGTVSFSLKATGTIVEAAA